MADDCFPLDKNHERIWLHPVCMEERCWCADPSLYCDNCEAEGIEYVRADLSSAEINRLLALLRECLSDYSHPNFTDRHGMADRLRDALKAND